jgi:hypothetical protein
MFMLFAARAKPAGKKSGMDAHKSGAEPGASRKNDGKPGPANDEIQARIPLSMLIRSEMPSDLYNPPW